MKLTERKIIGCVNVIKHFEGIVKIEIDNKIREFYLHYTSDDNGDELEIYEDEDEITDNDIKDFIWENWEEIDDIDSENSGWVEIE